MRRQPHLRRAASIILVLATALLTPAPARAAGGGHIDADLDLGAPLDTGSLSIGAGGRLGWRFDFGPVWLQPEVAGHYTSFLNAANTDSSASGGSIHVVRVLGGARLGGAGLISGVIEPALFGHAGYGWFSSRTKGTAFDVGFALDVKIVRHFSFGAHGAYNVVADSSEFIGASVPAFKWVSYGVHAGAYF